MDISGEAEHPTLDHFLKLAKQADIKVATAKDMIEQLVTVAKSFLATIGNYPINKYLLQQVSYDVGANINRMK